MPAHVALADVTDGFLWYLNSIDPAERAVVERLLAEGDPVMRLLARAPIARADWSELRACGSVFARATMAPAMPAEAALTASPPPAARP